jgi:hypothetical protein
VRNPFLDLDGSEIDYGIILFRYDQKRAARPVHPTTYMYVG